MKPSPRKAAKLILSVMLVQLLPVLPWANMATAAEAVAGAPEAKDPAALCQKRLGEIVALAKGGKMREVAVFMARSGKPLDYNIEAQKVRTDRFWQQILSAGDSLVYKGSKTQQKTEDRPEVVGLFFTATVEGKPAGMVLSFSMIEGEYRLVDVDLVDPGKMATEAVAGAPEAKDPAALCQKRLGEIVALAKGGKMREVAVFMARGGKPLDYNIEAQKVRTDRFWQQILSAGDSLIYKGNKTQQKTEGRPEVVGLFFTATVERKPAGMVLAFSMIEGEYRLVDVDPVDPEKMAAEMERK